MIIDEMAVTQAPSKNAFASLNGAVASDQEIERLVALRALHLLDTPASAAFDRITRLTAQALGMPIVLVSLVDESRQWFKSRVGTDAVETPRDISFCTHAVAARQTLLVPDATLDERFAQSILVTAEPHIRSYAGIPLFTRDDHAIGTLCAIDRQPRQFSERDLAILRDGALAIQDLIHAEEIAAKTDSVLEYAAAREKLFRDTFDHAAVGIVHSSLSGHFLRINPCACSMLGFSVNELEGLTFVDVTHPEDLKASTYSFQLMASGSLERCQAEKRYLRKDGTYLWALESVALVRQASGAPGYLVTVLEDISARKENEGKLTRTRDSLQLELAEQTRKLNESNQSLRDHIVQLLETERTVRSVQHRLRKVTDSIPALIGYWNRELRCEFANEAYRACFGHAPEKVMGMTMRELLGETGFKETEPYSKRALEGHAQRFERVLTQPDGSQQSFEIRYLPDINEATDTKGFFVLVTESTTARNVQIALEAANAKLANNVSTDYLTGIANHRALIERGQDGLVRFQGGGELFGLILLDLDDFAKVNSEHGHDVGDEVLRVVAKLLKLQLRSHRDLTARVSANRFAVLCFGDLDESLIVQIAERVRGQLAKKTIPSAKGEVRVTASAGLALVRPEDTSWNVIEMRADAALFKAKSGGKDRAMLAKAR